VYAIGCKARDLAQNQSVLGAGFEVSTLAKFQFRNFSNELNFFLFLGSAIGPRKGLIGEDRRRIRLIHSTATTRITQVVQPAGNLYYFFQA